MDAAPGKTYCGAHSIQLEPSLAREPRIDCPYGNHSVPESLFAKHLKTCPDKRHKDEIAAQPYNIPGINAGPGPDNFLPLAPPELATGKGDTEALSNRRLALAVRRGEAALMDLLQKIDQALATLAPNIEPLSVSIPPETEHYLFSEETTANRPYSRKHAQQQASIAGNMKRKGLMFPPDSGVTYVELGAGTGYLSLCLTECFGINKVALVDMNGFRLKADRAMRHLQLQRAKCNLADFDPQGLVGMGQGEPWVGYGKHLCGAATDFALRCCVRDIAQARTENSNGPLLIPGPTEAAESSDQASTKKGPRFGLKGLAIATCCHHRCEWRHFVGQEVMIELGFSPEEFELMSWMTGWALCGHEAPAADLLADSPPPSEPDIAADAPAALLNTITSADNTDINIKNSSDGVSKEPVDETPKQQQLRSDDGWRPHRTLSRKQRIIAGQQCKRLLDVVRLVWLQRQRFDAEIVLYVEPEVSGENRLLLAVPQ